MAELAVTTALGVLQIIIPLLSKLNYPINVEKDIKSMRSWHASLNAFMEDNYGRHGSQTMLDRFEKIRKIAYDIEDVVDEFILHNPPYTFHKFDISRKFHTLAHQVRHGLPLRGVSDKIASIQNDISDIRQQNASFNVSNSEPSSSSGIRVLTTVSPLLLDKEMIGYEKPRSELMRRMVDGDRRLVKIAVDGPGGSGKTTLVKNVFWKRGLQAQFDCHAWVSVCFSNHSDIEIEKICKNLLQQLCSSRKEPYPDSDGSNVQTSIHKYLTGKRYLVVLDGVWGQEDWTCLKDAFPDSFLRSRIVVTTRNSSVASIAASSSDDHVFTLPPLESSEGWRLFCRKAFPDSNGECPSELKDISIKILKRCEGLPLAIVAVAGALALKQHIPHVWERFHDNLVNGIGSNSSLSAISNALLPSYMDLSSNLKCCFLYFSIFPEDYSVERGRLIRLWVAERFVMETDDSTAEEVAEECLNELIQRNLVHVSKWDFDGRPRSVRVLNLLLNFIILRCKDENFASIFPREKSSNRQNNQANMIRRLSVHDDCTHFPENEDLASVRSMFLLRLRSISSPEFERNLRKLKFVRVLEVQGAESPTEFPEEITRFTLVRYLSFRDTKIKIIPSSIKRLSYLETLDLKQTQVTELPKEISHLQNLCHVFVYRYTSRDYVAFDSAQGVKLHEGINNLRNMQSLSLVKVGENGRILNELKGLIQLRKLGLVGLKKEHGKDLCAAVGVMKSLKTLDLCSATKDEFLDIKEMTNPPETLQRLYLKGRIEIFPLWVSRLDSVMRVGLKWSKLKCSPLESLRNLRNLRELQLTDCFIGEELVFEASGFKMLRILEVEDLENVNMMVIQEGAMAELKQISLRRCHRMRMLLGVGNLKKVKELNLHDMAEEFVARLRSNGEDREWVKRIPLIHSYGLKNRSWSLENLSDSVLLSIGHGL